ncbi:MAG: glycosyltransferase [Acidimicrobiales bacterium]|nr:glycosyltransferase [Acidimicrobiales bacterium]
MQVHQIRAPWHQLPIGLDGGGGATLVCSDEPDSADRGGSLESSIWNKHVSQSVVWLAQGFREYRRAFLHMVQARLGEAGVTFIAAHTHAALHTNQPGELRDTCPSMPLRAKRWRPLGREVLVSAFPPEWLNADLVVLPESIAYPTAWSILAARAVRNRRTAIFGHGTDFAKPGRDDLAEKLNRWRMRHLDWWFAYNEPSVDAVVDRGMPKDRVTSVQNTLDTEGLATVRAQLTNEEHQALRSELGVGAGPIGLFMGALYPNKRPDLLIAIAQRIRTRHPGFALLIVGDGELATTVEQARAARPWVVRVPGDTTEGRARYWAIADVALYPSAAGLAINEALRLGVPPVISSRFPHGPEASYVQHDVSGLIVDSNDPQVIADQVADLLSDAERSKRLSAGARAVGSELTIDEMVKRFSHGVLEALERAPHRVEERGQQ